MVYLYGSGGHTVSVTSHPLFQSTIVDRGYLLIVPAALGMTYSGGIRDSGWSLRNEPRQARDEIAFLRQVLEDAARRFPVDRNRILIAGQSRGGFLTWEIACHAPELGSAFASHAGGYLGDLPRRCQRPVRLLETHGLSDDVVPMTRRARFSGGAALPALDESLGLMSRTNSCAATGLGAEAADFFRFERRSWGGCLPGSSLDLMLHPGGHAMPWIWFRAILDWFEEPPTAAPENNPVTRVLGGARPEGVFKRPPASVISAE
jgi:polyhydroxybutyrate depolymerase